MAHMMLHPDLTRDNEGTEIEVVQVRVTEVK
jgi:hypothetical protein